MVGESLTKLFLMNFVPGIKAVQWIDHPFGKSLMGVFGIDFVNFGNKSKYQFRLWESIAVKECQICVYGALKQSFLRSCVTLCQTFNGLKPLLYRGLMIFQLFPLNSFKIWSPYKQRNTGVQKRVCNKFVTTVLCFYYHLPHFNLFCDKDSLFKTKNRGRPIKPCWTHSTVSLWNRTVNNINYSIHMFYQYLIRVGWKNYHCSIFW